MPAPALTRSTFPLPDPAVPVDDLLAAGARDPASPVVRDGPTIEPSRVRLIKVSAEMMDARVLAGLRRLLSVGRVPFVMAGQPRKLLLHKRAKPRVDSGRKAIG